MPLFAELASIAGAQELYDWFGYWPDFHDAEVLKLHLDRSGASSLVVHTWETTGRVNAQGFYDQARHVVVEFVLDAVSGLNLEDFNHQNVIADLGVTKTETGFRLELGSSYGLSGTIEAQKIAVRITPGKPPQSLSS